LISSRTACELQQRKCPWGGDTTRYLAVEWRLAQQSACWKGHSAKCTGSYWFVLVHSNSPSIRTYEPLISHQFESPHSTALHPLYVTRVLRRKKSKDNPGHLFHSPPPALQVIIDTARRLLDSFALVVCLPLRIQ
jgi:hypothetical protein